MPSRERKWTNMAGLKYQLTTNQKYVRNYVFEQARKMVMKQDQWTLPCSVQDNGGVCVCVCMCVWGGGGGGVGE